jgi:hypothetical protein
VDFDGGALGDSDAVALLNPVCAGQLTPRMARDLITPARYPAGRSYDAGRIAITAAFRTRHVSRDRGEVTSVFEPIHLLAGDDWLLTCRLPPRVYQGLDGQTGDEEAPANELYLAVAAAWRESGGETAADLAEAVHRELAGASDYRASIG